MSNEFDDEMMESADRGTALIDTMPEDEGSGEGETFGGVIGEEPVKPTSAAKTKPKVKKAKETKKAAPKKSSPKKSESKAPAAKPTATKAEIPKPAAVSGKAAVGKKSVVQVGTYRTKELKTISERLKQVSDWCRIGIMMMLDDHKECSVTDIVKQLTMSQPAVSHHLALLRHGHMIECRRDGKFNFYGLTDTGKSVAQACRSLMVD